MLKYTLALVATAVTFWLHADNQTADVSPIYPQVELPFAVELEQADFMLPNGLHSFATGISEGKWLIIAGRTNGLHGFGPGNNNFPPDLQNTVVYVVDHHKRRVWMRDLTVPESGLTQDVIDTLSVTSPQFYQSGNTLYMTGGYGVVTETGDFSTKDTLTAIDMPGLIRWVLRKTDHKASHYIRQTFNSALQVTGGQMSQIGNDPTLLVFGQNFQGAYHSSSNGDYTCQVRRFRIHDDGSNLSITLKDPKPQIPDPNYRRRDLNVVPIMEHRKGKTKPALMAYSGVFTPTVGVWTVPVTIKPDGSSFMEDPLNPETFKQGMNNYITATLGLYSSRTRDMYTVFFGGISYGFFQDGLFQTDSQFPFINQITTIKRNKDKVQTQYLMDATYPTILSQGSNPGSVLLFGAGAVFYPKTNLHLYDNEVVKFDRLKKGRTHIGYIVGGIMSTMQNTNTESDSTGSPYIFKVYILRK